MKWLIYLLLIFNIGFASWHFRGKDVRNDGAGDVSLINSDNRLILLSELAPQQPQKNNTSKKIVTDKLCYSLGPFIREDEADKILSLLRAQNVEIKRIQLRDTSRSGYWVILPASESRRTARKIINQLEKLKIKDYFLVATGSHENAISLGVYSQKKLARRRVDEMIRLGFIPRMESVALPQKEYWLSWHKETENQPADLIIEKLKKQHTQISRVERSCK